MDKLQIRKQSGQWFLAANTGGKWIIVEGECNVEIENGGFRATLFLSGQPDNWYHRISGTIDEEGFIEATVVSSRQDVPSFDVQGKMLDSDMSGTKCASITLTDGWSTYGITGQLEQPVRENRLRN
jgi:hypothetical protein